YPATMATSHQNLIGRAIRDVIAAMFDQWPIYTAILMALGSYFISKPAYARGVRILAALIPVVMIARIGGLRIGDDMQGLDGLELAALALGLNVAILGCALMGHFLPGRWKVIDLITRERFVYL